MKFLVFYLQSINSLEGPGMFFSSAAIIRRLRKYTAKHVACLPNQWKSKSRIRNITPMFVAIQTSELMFFGPRSVHWT